jgi:ankyrin repeat protein
MRYQYCCILLFASLLLITGCGHKNTPESDALLRAARDGKVDTVKELLTTPGIDVNAKDERGDTALIEAARFGHDHIAQVLLAAGANLKVRDKDGKTPLMIAIAGGHDEVVAVLKQAGAVE